MGGGVRSDAGLVEQLRRELAGERFDLACELAFLGGQLQDAAGDRAQREQAAAEFGIASAVGSSRCEALQQPGAGQRPQLAAQRLRGRDQQVAQLAEPGALRVHRAFAGGHQCLQRLAFAACRGVAGRSWPSTLRAARTASSASVLPPERRSRRKPADLEHPLAPAGQEARQTRTERACALDRERAPTRRMRVDELQRLRVAATARGHRRLEDDRAAEHLHDRERMRVAVRIDTDDVVQLICKHP